METRNIIELQGLTEAQRQYVLSKLSKEKESSIAYICWFVVGVHYFYLGKPIINLLYWITGGGFGIWAIIDLFRIPGLVREYNTNFTHKLVKEAKTLYP